MTPRIGVLGTLIWDRIERPGSPPVEQWGGAIYSLAGFSAACPPGWTVDPIVKIGADLWDAAIPVIRAFPHVEVGAGVRRVDRPNNRVELRYHDPARRRETLTGGVPPWTAAELGALTPRLSALYLNFISGMEMDLRTAAALRAGFGGYIYADLHSLFLGPPGAGPRRPRPLRDAGDWLRCFDAVQMNEDELSLLGVRPDGIGELIGAGPSLVLVTRGPEGAIYARGAGGGIAGGSGGPGGPAAVETGSVPSPGGAVEGDPTGCGDVWGATVCAALLGGSPLVTAIERAHRAAAAKVRDPAVERLPASLASSDRRGGVLP